MPDALHYRRLTTDDAVAAAGTLEPVTAAAYPGPPSETGPDAGGFTARLRADATRPGFAMVVAYDGTEPIGFAYGHTMPAGQWWPDTDRPAPPEMAESDAFAVIRWAVLPRRRGRGIGQRLLDDLLGGRPEQLGIVAVDPAAPAREIFAGLGWRRVGSTPTADIMVALINCAR
ncbi:Acetyltransferase (GNAT) family protein [Micromonospora pattaloongensis]|uniref:Acetyltransferase (GNAT) family protein n=1 Tax=Micromonospora pattaloongensis TaxID=405436 RepID=A0A1H3RVB9_9ACTN|nr:GNAT family N-acetyltransferase [Micromonospora pattaloongensis]SDZ29602.1 Acetyltransferase (GNAT) family protein [Micromonospora pattaloongensis]